jgi:hypothetical protein
MRRFTRTARPEQLVKALLFSFLLLPLLVDAQKRAGAPAQQAPSAADVAASATRSVVYILALDAMGDPLASGSGFFIDDSAVLTNYHVVKDSQRVLVSNLGAEQHWIVAELTAIDETRDLAVLKPRGMVGTPLKAATIKHRVGDKVYAIGNPEDFTGTFSEGIISGFRSLDGTRFIQITAPISHGSSGGPVLDEYGKVLGVATLAWKGQNLNLAVELDEKDLATLPQMVSEKAKARERGTTILDAALAANGGGKRLSALRDFTIRLHSGLIVQGQEAQGRVLYRYLLPDKVQVERIAPTGENVVVTLNGKGGWIEQGGITRDLPSETVERIRGTTDQNAVIFLLKLPHGSKVDALPDYNIGDAPADSILVTGPDDFSMTLGFDKSNHRLLKSTYERFSPSTRERFLINEIYHNHRQLDGFWVASHAVMYTNGQRADDQIITEFDVNSGLDPSIFEKPRSESNQSGQNSDEWKLEPPDQDTSYYVKRKDIQVYSDGHKTIWIKHLPRSPDSWTGTLRGYREALALVELDCQGHRFRVLQTVGYPQSGQAVVERPSTPPWKYLVPDSVYESAARYACSQ